MDWEVVWTEPAVADLEQIVRSTATRSPTGAESLRTELLDSVEVLARFPLIGPIYERDRTGRFAPPRPAWPVVRKLLA